MNLISNLWFPPPKSMKMRRGFQKPHQTFKLKFPSRIWLIFVAKDSWLPYWNCDGVSGNHITFLDAQPRIFGDQSRFGGYSQRYLATNHVLGSIAKDICRPIMFCLTWPPKKNKKNSYWHSNQEAPAQRACHAAQARYQEMQMPFSPESTATSNSCRITTAEHLHSTDAFSDQGLKIINPPTHICWISFEHNNEFEHRSSNDDFWMSSPLLL